MGEQNTAFAQYFVGNSYLKPLTKPGSSVVLLANVTFEPACRNNWHIHHSSKVFVFLLTLRDSCLFFLARILKQ